MAKILALIEATGIDNVRLHAGDAVDLLRWLPAGSLAGVDLLYADPWPKRRHWKRRFVQDDTVAMLARVLAPGASFRFASDIPDYVAWTLERVSARAAIRLDRRARRRLAAPLARLSRHPLRGEGEARGPCALLSGVSPHRREPRAHARRGVGPKSSHGPVPHLAPAP